MAWKDRKRQLQSTQERLVEKVTRQYGFDYQVDEEFALIALDFLDDAVKDMNSHLYEFNKRSETVTTVADQQDYKLVGGTAEEGSTVIPYKESLAYLTNADGTGDRWNLTYIPWYRFQERVDNIFSGVASVETYSFRNIEDDGIVSLNPAPADADKDLVIEYYIRIPLISALANEDTAPNIPEEVEVPLLYNAMKRMAIHLYGPGHKDVAGFHGLEQQALKELKAVDKRHPDQQQRFMLVDKLKRGTIAGRRSLYIKV